VCSDFEACSSGRLGVAAPAVGQSPEILMWYGTPQATLPPGHTLGPWLPGNAQWISPDGSMVFKANLLASGRAIRCSAAGGRRDRR